MLSPGRTGSAAPAPQVELLLLCACMCAHVGCENSVLTDRGLL